MASLDKTFESWSPAYSATVTNPNWALASPSTGLKLTHTGTTPDTLDGWIIIPAPVINNTVTSIVVHYPQNSAFSCSSKLRHAFHSSALGQREVGDERGYAARTGRIGRGATDGREQTISAGLITGRVGELKIGATVAAHVTFKEAPNADGKSEVSLIGAGVAFEFVDISVPETQPIGFVKEAENGGVNKGLTVTTK